MKKRLLLVLILGFTFNFINAQNILINEGFETWPASGWLTYELGVAGAWEQDPADGHTGDHSAKHPFANEGQNKNWLVSPQISLDNTTNYQVSFYSMAYLSSGVINVQISTGSGDPNSDDFQVLQSIDQSTWWMPVSIDLSAYQGQNVYLAFYVFTNTSAQWRFDDVLVAPISYFDAGLTEIVSPTGYNPETGIEDVVVALTNHGTETITDFDIQWTINDVFQPQYDGDGFSIGPDSTVDVTVGQFDFTEGMYEISALINVTDDAWENNNSASAEYSAGTVVDVVLNSITPSGSYPTAGSRDVIVNVSNIGGTILNDLTIEWSVNDIAQPDFNASGLALQPGESTSITIDQFNFVDGTHNIHVDVPLNFDLTPENNSKEEVFSVGGFYENFQGEYPPLLWTSYFSQNGNFAAQNSDPNNYHAYMLSINNNLDSADDTLYTPLLDIEDGDTFSFMGRFPIYLPGTITLVWKDGVTGEIHIIDEVSNILGWSEFNYDISAAAGINRIGWICTAEDVIGDFNMDDVSSTAPIFFLDNDLLVKGFDLDTVPQINIEKTINATVVNIGLNPVLGPDYTVKLMNGSTMLTSVSGMNISSPGEVVFEFPYTFTTVGDIALHIEVEYLNDDAQPSNVTPILNVYPVPENSLYNNIGEPNYISSYLPFNPTGFEFSGEQDLSQTLFYSNEIGSAGDIYGIKYPYTNPADFGSTISVKVWIAETTVDNLDSGWHPAEEFQLVFDGEIEYNPSDGYTYIPFETPLSYDGTTNLVVQNYAYDPSWIIPPVRYIATTGSEEVRSVSIIDRAIIDPANPPQGYNTFTDYPFSTFVVSPTANTGIVSGFVYDENNDPLANADITVEGTTVSTQTDETGAYSIQAIAFNDYSITASLFAYDDSTQTISIDQTNQSLDFILNLKPQISVSGHIVGSNDQDIPLPNVTITLADYSPFESISNIDGEFTMSDVYGNLDYTLNLSLYGYEDYTEVITIDNQDLDLGTIIMQETMLSTYNVMADGNAPQTTISWEIPNTGAEQVYIKDSGEDWAGFSNEPNENVWLGNYFVNPGTVTINDVEIHWSFVEGGVSDFVTVEILNENEEIIAVSDKFLTPFNEWINIDVPNMTITGDFYVMIHWEENPETTNFFSYNWSWDSETENTGVIKYPNQDVQNLTDYIGALYPALNFMIRPNIIELGDDGNDNNVVSYNIYKGLASVISAEIEEDELWEQLNASPVNDQVFIDNSWSSDYPNGMYMYAVEAVYTEGVAEYTFSNTIDIIITGIEDIIANNISVYPNPTSEFINITGIQGSELYLYDAAGKLVYTERIESDQTQLNVGNLPSGSYILNIVLDNNVITKKVSITKQ